MDKDKIRVFNSVVKGMVLSLVWVNFNFIVFSQDKSLENFQIVKEIDFAQNVYTVHEDCTRRLENIEKNLDKFDLDKKNKEIKASKSIDLSKKTINKLNVDLANKEKRIKELEYLLEKAQNKKNLNPRSNQSAKDEKSDLYKSLGTAYVQAKRYEDAIKAYNESLNLNPNNSDIHYYLGLLYQHANNNVIKSLKCFDRYLRLSPQGQYSQKAQMIMKILKQD